ncbi:MAG TPA: PAS domain-containing protein [Miltoncostaeaceae bacterium]|nr:PAS domain-containing protein [Miltoncostaeaceae bacterium]
MSIPPVDRESPFEIHELFFSTTNRKGLIEACNDVFVRVSRHPEEAMIGRPHNIIRHPEMPRALFRMVWDHLLAGKPIAGYVKNLAADGAYYWVLATWSPLGDGFLSVRLKPTSPMLETVKDIYAKVLRREHELERSGMKHRELAAEALPYLHELIGEAGFSDYDAFARHILPLEIRSREVTLRAGGFSAPPLNGPVSERLGVASGGLNRLFAGIEVFTAAATTLRDSTQFIHRLADAVHRNALNGLVAARKLTAGGATLGVVADQMSRCAESIATAVVGFMGDVTPTMQALQDIEYRIGLLKAQLDMATDFALELEDAHHEGEVRARREASLAALIDSAGEGIDALGASLAELSRSLRALERGAERIESALKVLDTLHMAGRIEAQHVGDAQAFTVLFDRVRQQLSEADAHMDAVGDAVAKAMATRSDTTALRSAIAQAPARVGAQVAIAA